MVFLRLITSFVTYLLKTNQHLITIYPWKFCLNPNNFVNNFIIHIQ